MTERPPPPPRAGLEAGRAPSSGRAANAPPVQELLRRLEAAEQAAPSPAERAELRLRAALLALFGEGDAPRACRLVEGMEHPAATRIRLEAALQARDARLLASCLDDARRRARARELGELGQRLLLEPDWAAEAAELLARAGAASSTPEAPSPGSGLWLALAGCLALGRGALAEAEVALAAASARDPDEVLCRMARQLLATEPNPPAGAPAPIDAGGESDGEVAGADQHEVQAASLTEPREAASASELAAAIEWQLLGESGLKPRRRLQLWLELGELRRDHLVRPEAAAEAYERALRLDPLEPAALAALRALYASLGREEDLARVLGWCADALPEPLERVRALEERGVLLERRDEWRAALAAYRAGIEVARQAQAPAVTVARLYLRCGRLQLGYLGQPGEAAASYLEALALDPVAETAPQALDHIFSAQGDWAGLVAALERRAALVAGHQRREVLARAARVAEERLRDARTAERLYGELRALDPSDSEGLAGLERIYERLRQWDRLLELLTMRLELASDGEQAIALHLRIAQICEEGLRNPERALAAYRKLLELAPRHQDAVDALGRLYEATEQWGELVEITRRQIRQVSDRAHKALLYFKCGSVMESKFGQAEDAIYYYEAAIKTSPACLPALHGLRDLYVRRQDWARVIQTLELELKLWTEEKERAGIFAHIGQIYGAQLGVEERAIGYYQAALEVDRDCLPANRALFEIYFARGEFARALPIALLLTQKVTRDGDPAERSEFYCKRAIVAERTGDARGAAESLVVALEIRPENLAALDLLVDLCRQAPESYEFIVTFQRLEKLYQRRSDAAALARVLVAEGALAEREYELEAAERLYVQALELAPAQVLAVEALATLYEKLRRFDAAQAVLEAFIARSHDRRLRIRARRRLAEITADGALDPQRAVLALEHLLADEPDELEARQARFCLAQQLELLGRHEEAARACAELTEGEGAAAPAGELAMVHAYAGRIAEASGDAERALACYRRALELDAGQPLAALSLARRLAADAAGRAPADKLVAQALALAPGRGADAELDLRRGVARWYASLPDRRAAIEACRTIVSRAPESVDDRVVLAELEIGAPGGLGRAREQLERAVELDIQHAPAGRLLAQVYQRLGELDRAARVNSVLALLGHLPSPPPAMRPMRRSVLSDAERRTELSPPAALGPLTEALELVGELLEALHPAPAIAGAHPAVELSDPSLKVGFTDACRVLGVDAELWVAPRVPGGMMALAGSEPRLYVEARLLVDASEGERGFVLGRALQPLRSGTSLLGRLEPPARWEVGRLLLELLDSRRAPSPEVEPLRRALGRKAARALGKLTAAAHAGVWEGSVGEWLAGLAQAADRAGLLVCDDVAAALRALARLAGDDLGAGPDASLPLLQGPQATDLVRYYLSDSYHRLHARPGGSPAVRP